MPMGDIDLTIPWSDAHGYAYGCAACGGTGYIKTHIETTIWRERVVYDEYKPCKCARATIGPLPFRNEMG